MDVRQPAAPTFTPDKSVDTIEAQVVRLDPWLDSILVIKSWDVDADVVRAVRERFNRQVLGVGPEDEVLTMNIAPTDTLIFKGDSLLDLAPDVLDSIAAHVKEKTGCKAVIFTSRDVDIVKQPE